MVKYPGVFHEVAVIDHLLKFRLGNKVVMLTIYFTRSCRACGMGDGQDQARVMFQQSVDQAGFAATGWCSNDKKIAALVSLLDILYLFTHLFYQHFQIHRSLRCALINRF